MSDQKQLPADLRDARIELDGISELESLENLAFDKVLKKWIFSCRINVSSLTRISKSTDWFVIMDEEYPLGEIKFFPSKKNGLEETFQHQSLNEFGDVQFPWRTGDLCLKTDTGGLLRSSQHTEEPGSARHRLAWHARRAVLWIKCADQGNLIPDGDYFELPVFASRGESATLYFFEEKGPQEFVKLEKKWGYAEVARSSDGKTCLLERVFRENGGTFSEHRLKNFAAKLANRRQRAMWFYLPEVPVVKEWKAPQTWDELVHVLERIGIDLGKHFVDEYNNYFRSTGQPLLLFAFPIPVLQGGAHEIIFWVCVSVPDLLLREPTGLSRVGRRELIRRNIEGLISRKDSLDWTKSMSLDDSTRLSRGKIDTDLAGRKILAIGAGAVGSLVVEALARTGVSQISIVDPDILNSGNLARHVLGACSLGKSKSVELARRVMALSPSIQVDAFAGELKDLFSGEKKRWLDGSQVVIETTGENEVLQQLSAKKFSTPKIFISVSVGYRCKRLYCYYFVGEKFLYEPFLSSINQFLAAEIESANQEGFPREGIGCWHPVFPASHFQLSVLANFAVTWLEGTFKAKKNSRIGVFEFAEYAGEAVGLRKIYEG